MSTVPVIPCEKDDRLKRLIIEQTEVLKTEAHRLGTHGLTEQDFYNSGLFRGIIERTRGQFAATMRTKREFVRDVLNNMQDRRLITNWEPSGGGNRHDYLVTMPTGRVVGIERLRQVRVAVTNHVAVAVNAVAEAVADVVAALHQPA